MVIVTAHNLAYMKTAWQIPPNPAGSGADVAVDCANGDDASSQNTLTSGDNPFWAVDLGDVYPIQEVSFTPEDSSEYL